MKTKNFSRKVLPILSRALSRAYPDAASVAISRVVPFKVSRRMNNVAFRADVRVRSAGRQSAFTVFGGWDKEHPRSKERTYRILKRLWNKGFDAPPLLVSEPVAYDAKQNFIAYKLVLGETLFSLIEKRSVKLPVLAALSGRWAARLHAVAPFAGIPKDAGAFDAIQMKKMSATFGRSSFFPKGERAAAKRLAQSVCGARKEARKQVRSLSLIHDDFHPQNIIVTLGGRAVAGIDFDKARAEDPMDDAAEFLIRIESDLLYRKTPSKQIVLLQRHFIKGYERERRKSISANEQNRLNIHLQWTALRLLEYTLRVNYERRRHAHNTKKPLCALENRFWTAANTPSTLTKKLFYA